MLGPLFVYSLLAYICATALMQPALGIIGFYGFILLDPAWNWRWSLIPGLTYQKYIFVSFLIGFTLSSFRIQPQSRHSLAGILGISLFWVVCYLSAQQSIAPVHTEQFMSTAWKVFLALILGVLILDTPSKLKALLIVAVVAQAYNAYQINLDYFQTGFARFAYSNWGSMGVDNNGYSIITIPLLAGAFSLAFFSTNLWLRSLYFGISLLQVHQIMLLQSRGSMLAGVFCGLLAVWKMPKKNGNVKSVVIAFCMIAALAGPSVVEEFNSSFTAEEDRDSSAESRFYLWQAGFRITKDYPFLGVGPNAARVLVPLPEYYEGGLPQSDKALHNLLFDVSTGMGIPGAICYFSFFLIPFYHAWKHYDPDDEELGPVRLAVLIGIPSYLLASMFSSGVLLESSYVLVLVGLSSTNFADRLSCSQGDQEAQHSSAMSAEAIAV